MTKHIASAFCVVQNEPVWSRHGLKYQLSSIPWIVIIMYLRYRKGNHPFAVLLFLEEDNARKPMTIVPNVFCTSASLRLAASRLEIIALLSTSFKTFLNDSCFTVSDDWFLVITYSQVQRFKRDYNYPSESETVHECEPTLRSLNLLAFFSKSNKLRLFWISEKQLC